MGKSRSWGSGKSARKRVLATRFWLAILHSHLPISPCVQWALEDALKARGEDPVKK
jgi:hypothetical protein